MFAILFACFGVIVFLLGLYVLNEMQRPINRHHRVTDKHVTITLSGDDWLEH